MPDNETRAFARKKSVHRERERDGERNIAESRYQRGHNPSYLLLRYEGCRKKGISKSLPGLIDRPATSETGQAGEIGCENIVFPGKFLKSTWLIV